MRVLLVRHAEAVNARSVSSDAERWLTAAGRATARAVGETLARMDLRFTTVLTSPLVRAVQTAEVLVEAQPGFEGVVRVHRPLANEQGTTAQALAPVDESSEEALILMVTHMPRVGMLASQLAGLERTPSFRTSEVCLIEVNAGRGRAQWMLDPDTLATRQL